MYFPFVRKLKAVLVSRNEINYWMLYLEQNTAAAQTAAAINQCKHKPETWVDVKLVLEMIWLLQRHNRQNAELLRDVPLYE